jgi:hypothetical protein
MGVRAPSLGFKWPGREADHTPPSSAEVKECVELYIHSPISLNGVVLRAEFKLQLLPLSLAYRDRSFQAFSLL